jgi:ATP-binding cassette, subfamily C, bacterial LapB
MKELMRRFMSRPGIALEMLVGSLFANVMAMASPLFVMQVLNRYVGQGVDATLYTLTSGVLIAIILEFAFRQSRMSLARGISVGPDEATALRGFETLTRAKVQSLDQTPAETRKEIVNGTAAIETAYNASNITTILDAPFSLLFIFVLYILEPMLAYVVSVFVVGVFLIGLINGLRLQGKTQELQGVSGAGSSLLGTVTREADTVRSFNAGEFLRKGWREHITHAQRLRRDVAASQGFVQTVTQSANGLMSVAVVAVGATLVVLGEMDVGAMIGGNILAARALQPVTKLAQLGSAFAKARQSLDMFKQLAAVELEADSGSALRTYSGRLEFRDAAFAYPGSTVPIFESLSLNLDPGNVLVITGDNGTGKSTLGRLLLGLLEPIRGQILVDGLDMKQVSPEWWRRQVIFLPQEPALLNATIEENLRINNPEMDGARLNQIVDQCGLRKFLDESPDGFETMVTDNGWRLSEGIRRRIALGRGLATDGMIAVIDEPTESLDADGCKAVHQILAAMAEQGKTIIVMSHDRNIVKGSHILLDLNDKPVPKTEQVGQPPQPEPQIAEPQIAQSQIAEAQAAEPPVPETQVPGENELTDEPQKSMEALSLADLPINPIPEIAEFVPEIAPIVPPQIHDVSDELGVEGIQSRFSVQKKRTPKKRKTKNGNGKKSEAKKRAGNK